MVPCQSSILNIDLSATLQEIAPRLPLPQGLNYTTDTALKTALAAGMQEPDAHPHLSQFSTKARTCGRLSDNSARTRLPV
jgi:hypothetical protein